jgi:hypothetical protein
MIVEREPGNDDVEKERIIVRAVIIVCTIGSFRRLLFRESAATLQDLPDQVQMYILSGCLTMTTTPESFTQQEVLAKLLPRQK